MQRFPCIGLKKALDYEFHDLVNVITAVFVIILKVKVFNLI